MPNQQAVVGQDDGAGIARDGNRAKVAGPHTGGAGDCAEGAVCERDRCRSRVLNLDALVRQGGDVRIDSGYR
ncbi:MAG: hypothetical protein ETSY2_14275 [Candidatus Entotheonella gemina]|uniref:Uncharacterized protein n=1 Tax=Candidatus Entotheonella gemina TaxID=1429439 RepID=W4MAI3_9BACT|nr:MAG: hypothetical protein ETSY2_14275 [Candidatus Entotheonella gemina]